MKTTKTGLVQGNGIYILLAIGLVALAIFGRLLPHLPNFTPIAAAAIFGGAVLPKKLALILPISAMVISDILIGLHPLVMFTWGSFVAIAWLSNRYLKEVKPHAVVGASLGASTLFYLVSNFGVWLEGKMYPLDIAGLLDCYYKAIPFFQNTVLGDLAFTAVLFGAYAVMRKLADASQKALSPAGNSA